MSTTLASGSSEVGRLARSVLGIFKLRIGVMIMVTALVGALVAPTASLGVGQWLVLAMSVLMASASAASMGDWTVINRDDGGKQWAYKSKPLYFWIKDQKPGDRTGDGFNNVWHLARP